MPIVKLRKLLTVPKEFTVTSDSYHVYQSEDRMLLHVPVTVENPLGKTNLAYFKKYGKRSRRTSNE
ncbi:hypothetical protein [Lactobacillus sp.]|uniref:hypothetical protein n=1 Tax=Lactobacillus sp. TaxID=1591 RepID=UPI003EF3C67A